MENVKSLKNLSAKMLKIMADVEYIQKTGVNQFHRYKYATESDVSKSFSKAMRENNVFMFSSVLDRQCNSYKTRGNKDAFLVTIKLEVTFVDAESGESFTSIFYGDGSDSDDKGVYKAITGAQKYALMKTFMVETGDDPERDNIELLKKDPEIDKEALMKSLESKANNGTEAFRHAWKNLTEQERLVAREKTEFFKTTANKADSLLQNKAS